MTTINPKALEPWPTREQIENALAFYLRCPDGQYDIDVACPVLARALAALPAGDEAEVVKRLRHISDNLSDGYEEHGGHSVEKACDDAASLIERQSATIAQLRGEVERLTGAAEAGVAFHQRAEAAVFTEKARADKAEARLASAGEDAVHVVYEHCQGLHLGGIEPDDITRAIMATSDSLRALFAAPDLAGKPESDGWIEWTGAPGWPEIEIRNNVDGSLDEIVMRVGGECIFHLEQMSYRSWWMGCCQGKKRVAVWLMARGKITAMIENDTSAPLSRT